MHCLIGTHRGAHTVLQGSHPGVRQTAPQGGITMISHRADSLPPKGGMETLAGNTYRLKTRETKEEGEMKRIKEKGMVRFVNEVRLGRLKRRKLDRATHGRNRAERNKIKKKILCCIPIMRMWYLWFFSIFVFSPVPALGWLCLWYGISSF